jgi:hypothetical protein
MLGTIKLPKSKTLSVAIFGGKVSTKGFTFNFPHSKGGISIDTTPIHIKVQKLEIAHWMMLPKDH